MNVQLAATDLRRVGAHPDHWYPVAWSRDLKPGKTLGVTFAGEPIVLVRPARKAGEAEKSVFALEDRCAHRQVPLHAGVVEGCAIRCCYHGWTYDRTGACIDVPYLGKGKLPNGVRSYPCHEASGLIFVFPGDAERAAQTAFPRLGASADPAYRTRRLGREVACHYSFMHENLMDMNHQFLHRRQMGQIRPRFRGLREGEDWMEVDYTFAREAGKQPLGEAAILGQRRSMGEGDHKDLMTIRTSYPYQELRIWTSAPEPVMELWICYTPLDAEQRRHRTFGVAGDPPAQARLPARSRLAGAGVVHGADFHRGSLDRRRGAEGARRAGGGLEPGGFSAHPCAARLAGAAGAADRRVPAGCGGCGGDAGVRGLGLPSCQQASS